MWIVNFFLSPNNIPFIFKQSIIFQLCYYSIPRLEIAEKTRFSLISESVFHQFVYKK